MEQLNLSAETAIMEQVQAYLEVTKTSRDPNVKVRHAVLIVVDIGEDHRPTGDCMVMGTVGDRKNQMMEMISLGFESISRPKGDPLVLVDQSLTENN